MVYFEEAKTVFNIPRPKVFTDDPKHCEECEEVEGKAQRSTPDALTLEEAGHGWADLHILLNDIGFLYFFPASIRFCIETSMDEGFLDSFFFVVTYEGKNNSRLNACTKMQRIFVRDFIVWYRNITQNLSSIGW